MVVDFTATWRGPCQRIAPVFEKLATEMEDVLFVKVDVDENEETARVCEITVMPTPIYTGRPNPPITGPKKTFERRLQRASARAVEIFCAKTL